MAILFIVLIAVLTYEYISWTSDDMNKIDSSKCFNVLYDIGTDFSGDITPSADYTGGIFTTVKLDINSNCDIRANGKLYLYTSEDTSTNLYSEGLLNYHIVKGNTLVDSCNITSGGEIEIDLGELSKSTSATTSYTVYVWIDNNLVENFDTYSAYYGEIRVEAIQISR